MTTLLEKAKSVPSENRKVTVTEQEVELIKAWCMNEVNLKQVLTALGMETRHGSYINNRLVQICKACISGSYQHD